MGLLDLFRNYDSGPRLERKARALADALDRLPDRDVHARVEWLLRDPRRIRLDDTPATAEDARRLGGLPPLARGLIARHASIVVVHGSLGIERDLVCASSDVPGAVRIGTDFDWAEVVVHAPSERVTVAYPPHVKPVDVDDFATVHHCLLFHASLPEPGPARLLYGDG